MEKQLATFEDFSRLDIRVGTILELVPEESGTSTIAVVEPGADINKLTHVFIVTDDSSDSSEE